MGIVSRRRAAGRAAGGSKGRECPTPARPAVFSRRGEVPSGVAQRAERTVHTTVRQHCSSGSAQPRSLSVAIAAQAVVADALEPGRQNVEQEAVDDLLGAKGHDLLVGFPIILPAEPASETDLCDHARTIELRGDSCGAGFGEHGGGHRICGLGCFRKHANVRGGRLTALGNIRDEAASVTKTVTV